MARRRLIRASEIGEYVYCRRAWWLHHIEGVEPQGSARRERGVAAHHTHGRRVWASSVLLIVGVGLALLAAVLLLL